MNVETLAIHIGDLKVGWIFKFALENAQPIIRFQADDTYAAALPGALPTLSASMLAANAERQRLLSRMTPILSSIFRTEKPGICSCLRSSKGCYQRAHSAPMWLMLQAAPRTTTSGSWLHVASTFQGACSA